MTCTGLRPQVRKSSNKQKKQQEMHSGVSTEFCYRFFLNRQRFIEQLQDFFCPAVCGIEGMEITQISVPFSVVLCVNVI